MPGTEDGKAGDRAVALRFPAPAPPEMATPAPGGQTPGRASTESDIATRLDLACLCIATARDPDTRLGESDLRTNVRLVAGCTCLIS